MLDANNNEVQEKDVVKLVDVSNTNPYQWKNGEVCVIKKISRSTYGKYAVLRKENNSESIAIFFSHEFQKI